MLLTWLLAAASAVAAVHEAQTTPEPRLQRRINAEQLEKQKQKLQEAQMKAHGASSSSTDPGLRPWIRTIYGDKVEIVTPTVVQGVTFSAKPPKTTDGLEYWVSLDKNGSPKTIKPQLKNGRTKNGPPDYSTWFATPTTIVYSKEELKAHNMADDEVFEHVEYIEEDQTYHALSPLIRCTPDAYHKKGISKQMSSEPFCFPRDNAVLKADSTRFVTWYSRYFDADNVRIHLSSVKPSLHDKGLKKRSAIMDKGGKITEKSFYVSPWIPNDTGFFPLSIEMDWFKDQEMERKVLMSIQPDSVPDDEYDYMKNSLVVEIIRPGNVYKGHNEDLKLLEEKQRLKHLIEEEDGLDYEKYFAIMGIPMAVCIIALIMYIFVSCNKVDLSHLKKRRAAGKNTTHRRIPFVGKKTGYHSLPMNSNDLELKPMGKSD